MKSLPTSHPVLGQAGLELTMQEVVAILGEKELRLAAQAKYIAALESKLHEANVKTSAAMEDRTARSSFQQQE